MRLSTWNTHKDGVAGCIYVETFERNRVLYLTEAGVAEPSRVSAGFINVTKLGNNKAQVE